ncbi:MULTISPECIES: LysR substrate-binding domain-containing protein [unclassified Rhizobium]|uniref:LysR substrate-binding domain-containing protein n=1 Tax=unclassified Rhizobium TaxID=2613769 RepID=UPI002B236CDA|nr:MULTISPECIES: LysR substrate-binding domain-containing protein [unclassified Rhizobium]
MPHRLCCYASPEYLAGRSPPTNPDQLEEHETVCLLYQSSGQLFRWPFRVGVREVEIVPSSGVIADASEAVPATIAAGAGIGMATSLMASGWVRRGALMPVLADYAVERHNITARWPERWRSNPAVRASWRVAA